VGVPASPLGLVEVVQPSRTVFGWVEPRGLQYLTRLPVWRADPLIKRSQQSSAGGQVAARFVDEPTFPLYIQELTYGQRALIKYDFSAGYPNHKVVDPYLLQFFRLIRNQLT
jgi:hypothetical protein